MLSPSAAFPPNRRLQVPPMQIIGMPIHAIMVMPRSQNLSNIALSRPTWLATSSKLSLYVVDTHPLKESSGTGSEPSAKPGSTFLL